MCVHACECAYAPTLGSQRHHILLELELDMGAYKLHDVGLGNKTLVLCKSSTLFNTKPCL